MVELALGFAAPATALSPVSVAGFVTSISLPSGRHLRLDPYTLNGVGQADPQINAL
jgi:hypothetical protein